jgi:DNA-3-methyladenine glycosylase
LTLHPLETLTEFDDRVGRIDARAQLHTRVELGSGSDHDAWMKNTITSRQNSISQHPAQLAPLGVDVTAVERNLNRLPIVAKIRNDGARTQVDTAAENGVADIVQMGSSGGVEQDRVLDLGVGSDDAPVADPAAITDKGSGPNLDIPSDPDRPLHNGSRVDPRPTTDHDSVAIDRGIRVECDLDTVGRQRLEHGIQSVSEQRPGCCRVVGASKLLRQAGEQSRYLTGGHGSIIEGLWEGQVKIRQALGAYRTLPSSFYRRPAEVVAPDLLGRYIVRQIDGVRLVARIVETEAYLGTRDRASHAWGGRRTQRSGVLYSTPGTAYVYLIYGMYNCLNAVTGDSNDGDAVLIRAAEPLRGVATMRLNRALKRPPKRPPDWQPRPGEVAGGPGKLCQALSIDRDENNRLLTQGKLRLTVGSPIEQGAVITGPRIGIDYAGEAKEWPLRFAIRDNRHVSKPYPW